MAPTSIPVCEIPSMIFSSAPAVSFAILVPAPTFLIEVSIRSVVSLAALDDWVARLLTSSATTAKPFPCCPALAASTAALSARIFVWKAISSITLMILPIFWEDVLISSIARSISDICSLPTSASVWIFSANCLVFSAFCAFCVVCEVISSIDADNSSTELACSVAPWESAVLVFATSAAPESTCSATDRMLIIILLSCVNI
ncbi:hypothetical protein SDC9_170891 [bioreactor metagenome]|uniref:Uncharacterized protein n=1 Tax=bioreactor metagenome TaxID=1076179 RepID=A0A645GIE9_9ZZZZ